MVPNPVRQHVLPGTEALQTAPVGPRHPNITRQTSSPLPNKNLVTENPNPGRTLDTVAGRAHKEEVVFLELGYLSAPYPPDELKRRRALYQFNIWNTGPDINFERIEHLTKLVFSTKIVVISLIDGIEQYVSATTGVSRNY